MYTYNETIIKDNNNIKLITVDIP